MEKKMRCRAETHARNGEARLSGPTKGPVGHGQKKGVYSTEADQKGRLGWRGIRSGGKLNDNVSTCWWDIRLV